MVIFPLVPGYYGISITYLRNLPLSQHIQVLKIYWNYFGGLHFIWANFEWAYHHSTVRKDSKKCSQVGILLKFSLIEMTFLVCCHPNILLPWQRGVTTSLYYCKKTATLFLITMLTLTCSSNFFKPIFAVATVRPRLIHTFWVWRTTL